MPLKYKKPTTPGQRGQVSLDYSDLGYLNEDLSKYLKKLKTPNKEKAGRNNKGRITIWHRGGGHKRAYRIILFKRKLIQEFLDAHSPENKKASVFGLLYDPNRSASLALLGIQTNLDFYQRFSKDQRESYRKAGILIKKNSLWFYILAPKGLNKGDTVSSRRKLVRSTRLEKQLPSRVCLLVFLSTTLRSARPKVHRSLELLDLMGKSLKKRKREELFGCEFLRASSAGSLLDLLFLLEVLVTRTVSTLSSRKRDETAGFPSDQLSVVLQ